MIEKRRQNINEGFVKSPTVQPVGDLEQKGFSKSPLVTPAAVATRPEMTAAVPSASISNTEAVKKP